eukprot:12478074-Alexandrium_andersonii.AAC.2
MSPWRIEAACARPIALAAAEAVAALLAVLQVAREASLLLVFAAAVVGGLVAGAVALLALAPAGVVLRGKAGTAGALFHLATVFGGRGTA